MNEIVNVVFRLLNFGVLIGLGVFVFKRYIFAHLKKRKQEKDSYAKSLVEQQRALTHQKNSITEQIQEDEQIYTLLKKKMMIWRKTVEREIRERYEEKAKRIATLQERLHEREQAISKERLYKQIVPEIVEQTESSLQRYFTEKVYGERFNNQIVEYLSKS